MTSSFAVDHLIVQALAGWLLADFMSGFFHWWEDRVGQVDWPVIGAWVVKPNRLHHQDSLDFTRRGLIERNAPLWAGTALLAAIWLALWGASVFWAVTFIGAAACNEVHRLAHVPSKAGPLARMAQEIGVFQSSFHHARHHRAPRDKGYCVLTNWLNPVLDGARFWSLLEGSLGAVGLEPNRGAR
jgi:hypothetical protein